MTLCQAIGISLFPLMISISSLMLVGKRSRQVEMYSGINACSLNSLIIRPFSCLRICSWKSCFFWWSRDSWLRDYFCCANIIEKMYCWGDSEKILSIEIEKEILLTVKLSAISTIFIRLFKYSNLNLKCLRFCFNQACTPFPDAEL